MHYKGSTMSVRDIARELHVDAVVDGSVFRAGDNVRIQLQLIQADPERHIWAQTYERNLRDVLALHNEIASTVARQIAATLSPSSKKRLRMRARHIRR